MKTSGLDSLFELLSESLSNAEIKTSSVISDISFAISKERIKKNMSQSEFAKFMGVSQGMVSKWESGDYNFTIKSISEIFDKLDLDFDFIIKYDNTEINYDNVTIMSSSIKNINYNIDYSNDNSLSIAC